MPLKQPPFLKEGDTVGIVSTGNPIAKRAVLPAQRIIESWGVNTVLGKTIGPRKGSFAGPDELRLQDYQEMLDNENIKAILHANGGDGAVRIMDKLDYKTFKKKPKWIAGYSDVTFMHCHINGNFGIQTIHSTMPIDISSQGILEDSWETLRRAYFGEELSCEMKPHKLNRTGHAKGALVGGNLSILSPLQGTNSDIDTDGKILFIECVGEHHFRIETYLMCLKKAGKFDKLKGMIIGRFTAPMQDHPNFGYTTKEIVMNAVKEFDFPVCFNYPAGHEDTHCALVFGAETIMNVSRKGAFVEILRK
ncbi:MAG TPA: LD-carboxypeptidase [Patescibacteria group bacterium]|nr:LD-carboxypeptidase [Patescibacteria group bacterium]